MPRINADETIRDISVIRGEAISRCGRAIRLSSEIR
jgi:hypothetical protein